MSSMFLVTSGVFANDIAETKENSNEEKATVSQVCCVRSVSDPESGQSASARACVEGTGDAQIDMGKACEKALKGAKAALKEITSS